MKELLQKLEEHSNNIINQKGKATEAMRNLELQVKKYKKSLNGLFFVWQLIEK